MEAFTNALTALGFAQTEFTAWKSGAGTGFYMFTREGFEGAMEIHDCGARVNWMHRTAECGAGTGIRPVGGCSIKQMVKYINKAS